MKPVLQVTPALDAGGVERTTIEIAAALSRAGARALVASQGGRLEAELKAAGGELVRLPTASKNPLTIWTNAGRLAAVARGEGVGLIHARSRAPAWSAYWAARRLRLPFVTTYHGIYNARTPWKRAYNAIMAKGDLVIANSHFTRAHVIAEHGIDPERVIAIPRGVDLARFDPAAIEPARIAAVKARWALDESSGLVCLLPARVTRWKGQALAVDAAADVLAKRPNALTLILAGDAQGRDDFVAELNAQIAARGASARIRLVGHVEDMPAALAASDIVLAPSLEPEAFGRAAAEAQAMGVPVLAADHGGFTETILPGETGWRVAPGDRAAWARALETVLDQDLAARRAMGAAGKSRARRLYAASALQEATLLVYARLLGEGR